jgi:hypothetical protein
MILQDVKHSVLVIHVTITLVQNGKQGIGHVTNGVLAKK